MSEEKVYLQAAAQCLDFKGVNNWLNGKCYLTNYGIVFFNQGSNNQNYQGSTMLAQMRAIKKAHEVKKDGHVIISWENLQSANKEMRNMLFMKIAVLKVVCHTGETHIFRLDTLTSTAKIDEWLKVIKSIKVLE